MNKFEGRKGIASESSSFIIVVTILTLVIIAALQSLPPNDFFPYVRIGEEIVKTGQIPTTEFMTYTQFGKPVEYAYWLPSLIFMSVFELGGVTLTTIMVMLCVAAYFILLWLCLRELKISPPLSAILILLFGLTGGSTYLARPQIFAFPLFGLTLLILIKWLNSDDRLLWVLPLITILWVNLHGSFILQFFLIIPAIIFGNLNRKKLIIFSAIAMVATMINLYGFSVWKSILVVVGNESNRLFSLEFQKPINEGWQSNILFGSFLVITVLTGLLKPNVKFIYWVWYFGFGWMALIGIRYKIWFLAIVTILFGLVLDGLFRSYFHKNLFQNRKMNLIIEGFLFLFTLACLPGVRGQLWEKAPPSYSITTPLNAVEWLRNNPQLQGEILCDFASCTYMTYALPERKLFITNRMDDFPVEIYEDYLNVFQGRYNWESVINKYRINLVLFNYVEQPVLLEAISSSPSWEVVYQDEFFVVAVRT